MSLRRAWRRQLLRAWSAALIVPTAMLAALAVLALGGGFGSIGVLGQLFAGPSLPGVGNGSVGGGYAESHGGATASLPVVPAVATVSAARGSFVHRAPLGRPLLTASSGTGAAGGAIGDSGGTGVSPVTEGAGGSGGGSSPGSGPGSGTGSGSGSSGPGGPGSGSGSGSSGPGSSSPAPAPRPSPPPPQPTPVDTAVKVVTSVTQQLPAPVGPVVTQTAQAAGAAVDDLLPGVGQP